MTAAMYMIILLTGIFFLGLIALIAAWLIQWRYQVKLDYFSKVMNATGKALMVLSGKETVDSLKGEEKI